MEDKSVRVSYNAPSEECEMELKLYYDRKVCIRWVVVVVVSNSVHRTVSVVVSFVWASIERVCSLCMYVYVCVRVEE
jgi:hypothetical protein